MERLNDILHELGISKVKLAKFLGVSRQMVYNYLDLDDINKWPKDKKVLLLNLLGVKNASDIDAIIVDTDYILTVEAKLNSILVSTNRSEYAENTNIYNGLGKKQKELLNSIINIIKENLEDDDGTTEENYYIFKYLYHFIQAMDGSKELKYILAYVSKAAGFVKPNEFKFNENEQFVFEGILFSGFTLYHSGTASKTKIAESHRRFVNQIEHKMEEKLSRTLELNSAKVQALRELGYAEINEKNAAEVLEKIAEIQSRKVG